MWVMWSGGGVVWYCQEQVEGFLKVSKIVLILLQHVNRLLFVFQYSIKLFSKYYLSFHLIYVFCAQMFFNDDKNKHWKNFILDQLLGTPSTVCCKLEAVSNRKWKTWNKVELELNDHRMLWGGKSEIVQSHGLARE